MRSLFVKNDPALDDAIERIYIEMNAEEPESEEYSDLLSKLERLHTLKTQSRNMRVSPDALVAAGSSLLGILLIVAYEQKHVITSKGIGFIPKLIAK